MIWRRLHLLEMLTASVVVLSSCACGPFEIRIGPAPCNDSTNRCPPGFVCEPWRDSHCLPAFDAGPDAQTDTPVDAPTFDTRLRRDTMPMSDTPASTDTAVSSDITAAGDVAEATDATGASDAEVTEDGPPSDAPSGLDAPSDMDAPADLDAEEPVDAPEPVDVP